MVKLTGTIPIYYNQAKYNIPLIIWIPETYPKSPPIVYLTPTKGMVIKDDHHSVDKNGLVETIYIRSWNPQHCELLGMVHDMTQGFSKNPPLFAQSTSRPSMNRSYPMRTSPPPREPVQSQRTHEYTQGMGLFPQNQTYPQRTAELSLPSPPSTSPPPNDASMEYIKRRYRESLIRVLSERVRQSVYELIRNGRPEPGKAKEIHATLCRRRQELAQRIHTLQAEREGYEHDVQVMAAAIDEINAWMSNLGLSSLQSGESLRPEDVIVPQDPLAEQLLAAQAEDLAAEDCLNALDKLFEKEKLDLETYLKQVRLNSLPFSFKDVLDS